MLNTARSMPPFLGPRPRMPLNPKWAAIGVAATRLKILQPQVITQVDPVTATLTLLGHAPAVLVVLRGHGEGWCQLGEGGIQVELLVHHVVDVGHFWVPGGYVLSTGCEADAVVKADHQLLPHQAVLCGRGQGRYVVPDIIRVPRKGRCLLPSWNHLIPPQGPAISRHLACTIDLQAAHLSDMHSP